MFTWVDNTMYIYKLVFDVQDWIEIIVNLWWWFKVVHGGLTNVYPNNYSRW